MGHLSAVGQSPDEALDRVLDAYARLTGTVLPAQSAGVVADAP
jgi:hypothetical protein